MGKKSGKTKSKVSRVINVLRSKTESGLDHARESLKLLETLEKETIARAKTFVKNPLPDSKRITNHKILASLKSLGVATRSEFEALEQKVDRLEAELIAVNTALAQAGAKRTKTAAAPALKNEEAFPT